MPSESSGLTQFVGFPLCVAGGLCLVVLALFSLGSVPPLYYGLKSNKITKYVDIESAYGSGRYLILPWNKFLLFPSTAQTIEFTNEYQLPRSGIRYPALHTRTKEGLGLHLQVSLQYRLLKTHLGRLYAEFNMGYEELFISTIREELIKALSDYHSHQLWTERQAVSEEMLKLLNIGLHRTYAECWGLQLMVIELPSTFEYSIVRTQIMKQMATLNTFEQRATQVRAHTNVIAAEFERNVTVIKAHGRANYTLTTKRAAAEARKRTIKVESNVLKSVREGLSLDSGSVLSYARYSAIKSMPDAELLYGFAKGQTVILKHDSQPAPPVQQTPSIDNDL